MKINVAAYDSGWITVFRTAKAELGASLISVGPVIEHVGSTSVPGLAAKPVVDIMVGIPDFSIADSVVPLVVAAGYEYDPASEDAMPYRRYFRRRSHGRGTHHIHMVELGGDFWERHILFRDYLRKHEDVRQQYAELKLSLAKREWPSGQEFCDAKTDFIRSVEARARARR